MNSFLKIIIREFKLLSRNSVILAVFIGAPIAYALLIGAVYQDAKVTDLPVIIIDYDSSPLSDKLIDAVEDNQYLKVAEVRSYTDHLHSDVVNNNYHAVIMIPEKFEADIQQKRHPEVNVEINAANMLTANYATTGIMKVLGTINAGIEIESLKKKGIPQSIAIEQYESFKITTSRFFNPSSNYLFFLWPGMLGTVMQQVFLLTLALSFAQEFESGTFRELLKESKSAIYLIFVKSIPYWILGVILWFPLIRLFFPLFNVPLIEAKLPYWTITSLFVVALTFLGIAVSIVLKTQLKATEVLMVIAAPSFIISGQTWPLEQMPGWVQTLANAIPLTHYLDAFRKLLMYKISFNEVMPQIYKLIAISLVSLIVAIAALKLKIRKTLKK